MDQVRNNADHYFNRMYMNKQLPVSTLYIIFFTDNNYNTLTNIIESTFNVKITESFYYHEILEAMFKCFENYPFDNLNTLNQYVVNRLTCKFKNLKSDKDRYLENIKNNQSSRFLTNFDKPLNVTKRKDSLSFTDALFFKRS